MHIPGTNSNETKMPHKDHEASVPTWDGAPEKWDTYVVKVNIYLKTEPKWKLSQAIAKLTSRLTGKAWELIEQTEEAALDALASKELFLAFLKKNLLASAVPELGRHFRRWFALRRLKSESMKLYVMRHRKMLLDLEKAMTQVDNGNEIKQHLEDLIIKARLKSLKGRSSAKKTSDRASDKSNRSKRASKAGPAASSQNPEPQPKVWRARNTPVQTAEEEEEDFPDPDEDHPAFAGEQDDGDHHFAGNDREYGDWDWEKWKWDYELGKWVEKESEVPKNKLESLAYHIAQISQETGMTFDLEKVIEIVSQTWRNSPLPDLLTGWNLLQKSGLSAQERATILAASSMSVGGSASKIGAIKLALIESALQTQWQDEELRERDDKGERRGDRKNVGSHRRAYGAEGSDDDMKESSSEQEQTADDVYAAQDSESSEDGERDGALLAEMSDSEERATFSKCLIVMDDAKRNIKHQRRTFAQAKAVVREIRRNRLPKFKVKRTAHAVMNKNNGQKPFKPKTRAHSTGPKVQTTAHAVVNRVRDVKLMACFRCGKKGHLARDCSQPMPAYSSEAHATLPILEGFMANSESESTDSLLAARKRVNSLRTQLREKEKAALKNAENVLLSRLGIPADEAKFKEKRDKKEKEKDRKREKEKERAREKERQREHQQSQQRSRQRSHRHGRDDSRDKTSRKQDHIRRSRRDRTRSASRHRHRQRSVSRKNRHRRDRSPVMKVKSERRSRSPSLPGAAPKAKAAKLESQGSKEVEKAPPPSAEEEETEEESEEEEERTQDMEVDPNAAQSSKTVPPVLYKAVPPPLYREETPAPTREVKLTDCVSSQDFLNKVTMIPKAKPMPQGVPPNLIPKAKSVAQGMPQQQVPPPPRMVPPPTPPPKKRMSQQTMQYMRRQEKKRQKVENQDRKSIWSPSPVRSTWITQQTQVQYTPEEIAARHGRADESAKRREKRFQELGPYLPSRNKVKKVRGRWDLIHRPIWPRKGCWHNDEPEEPPIERVTMNPAWDQIYHKVRSEGRTFPQGFEFEFEAKVEKDTSGDAEMKQEPRSPSADSDVPSPAVVPKEEGKLEAGDQVKQELGQSFDRPPPWEFPEGESDESLVFQILSSSSEQHAAATGETGLLNFIIDTGATGSLMSVGAAEAIVSKYPDALLSIDTDDKRKYRVASGGFVVTSSRATFRLPVLGCVTADILESPEGTERVPPTLLGIDWLKENRAILDISNSSLTVNGKNLPTRRQQNGHLIVSIGNKDDH